MNWPPETGQIILGFMVAITAWIARKGRHEARDAKDSVRNGVTDRLTRIESATSHISQRLDDHIEAHKERSYARKIEG